MPDSGHRCRGHSWGKTIPDATHFVYLVTEIHFRSLIVRGRERYSPGEKERLTFYLPRPRLLPRLPNYRFYAHLFVNYLSSLPGTIEDDQLGMPVFLSFNFLPLIDCGRALRIPGGGIRLRERARTAIAR